MTACTHPVYRPGRASHSRQLGALMRAGGNLLLTGLRRLYGRQVKRSSSLFRQVAMLARGTGPGLNSGLMLDEMLGSALANKTGDADITLGDVQRRFGKRLVIIVTELTSGKERQLTPETHADLPLRIASRCTVSEADEASTVTRDYKSIALRTKKLGVDESMLQVLRGESFSFVSFDSRWIRVNGVGHGLTATLGVPAVVAIRLVRRNRQLGTVGGRLTAALLFRRRSLRLRRRGCMFLLL